MTDERPTIRPVSLGRITEVTHLCDGTPRTTEDVLELLNVSKRRARETILEALRIDLIESVSNEEEKPDEYLTTTIGDGFLAAVRNEAWKTVNKTLQVRSPHYKAFLEAVDEVSPATLQELLDVLEENSEFTPYKYNQTSVELLGDWAERLGVVQRNAFTGSFYRVERESVPTNFGFVLLSAYDELEQTAGVNLRQRHLSIPKLREFTCERLGCRRSAFDEGLLKLVEQNIGRVELSGAPLDTAAKDSPRAIRRIELSEGETLVSTTQTSDQVMAGVEQFGKKYYYLAVYDRDLTFNMES
ncbi:hypothetical protein [Haladaptatus sp. CMSO5]|uniref:hypothetical protein n=1 Tax=Haladaptatus sp. CMSO5 TaxID=3120514 RepID=UPI002FCDE390